MTPTPVRGALTALALLLIASPALAQPTPPDMEARHQHMHDMMQQHREMMMRDLHTILNIHPDQESAFAAFQASMKPPEHMGDRVKDHAAMATMTTPQKLDMMLAYMDEHTARMRKHVEATKAFYAALNPEQQRVFDALERMHHHGMLGHGGWDGHGGEHKHDMESGPPPPPGE